MRSGVQSGTLGIFLASSSARVNTDFLPAVLHLPVTLITPFHRPLFGFFLRFLPLTSAAVPDASLQVHHVAVSLSPGELDPPCMSSALLPLLASHWRYATASWCVLPCALPVSRLPLLWSHPRWKGCPGSRKERGVASRYCHVTPRVREAPVWFSAFLVESICGIRSWRSQTDTRIHTYVFSCGRYTQLQ